MSIQPARSARRLSPRLVVRLAVLAGLAVLFVAATQLFGDELNLQSLAARETALRMWMDEHPLQSLGLAFAVYAVVTGLSVPGAVPLSMACGWLFGFWRGLVVVSFASTLGATLAFLISRFLLRDLIQQRHGVPLQSINDALRREGAFYLFALRLTPVVPFTLLNLAMGVTPMPVATFWWVSQLGMLPGTAAFVWAGASAPSLQELAERGPVAAVSPQLLLALACLGLLPLVLKRIVARWLPKSHETSAG